LLRHGRVWGDGEQWTAKQEVWIRAQRFDERTLFADAVHRLAAYRGITELGALTLASEVCDWRRFPTAGMFMGFTGLVPSDHSSGEGTHRGGITHASS
jgi:transposase